MTVAIRPEDHASKPCPMQTGSTLVSDCEVGDEEAGRKTPEVTTVGEYEVNVVEGWVIVVTGYELVKMVVLVV